MTDVTVARRPRSHKELRNKSTQLSICFVTQAGQSISPTVGFYLLEDEEVEEDHAEVVYDEGFAELEGLPVLHVFRSQPKEEQVGGADGQSG